MIRFVVGYPNNPGAKFDERYYLDVHMPMVQEKWGPHGMDRYEIDKGLGGAPGTPAPYSYVAHLYFNSMEGLQAAIANSGAEVMGDIPNYTDVQPIIQVSQVVV